MGKDSIVIYFVLIKIKKKIIMINCVFQKIKAIILNLFSNHNVTLNEKEHSTLDTHISNIT